MIDLRKITLQFLIDNAGKEFLFTSNITGESTFFEMDDSLIAHFSQFPEMMYKLSPNFKILYHD